MKTHEPTDRIFDMSTTEAHAFRLHSPGGPADVTVGWYPERTNLGAGHVVWDTKVIRIPPGEVVDIPREPPGYGFPMLTEPDREPSNSATLRVDFSKPGDVIALVLYRIGGSVEDTLVGDAVVTNVLIHPGGKQ